MGGISIWQLLIIAVIVILLFGTKKLRNVGSDVGGAIKSFKKAMNEDDAPASDNLSEDNQKLEADTSAQSSVAEEKSKENA